MKSTLLITSIIVALLAGPVSAFDALPPLLTFPPDTAPATQVCTDLLKTPDQC